ncbi:MAG: IclR family transcriptional regulator [Haloarculaceae archaeon]
MTARDAQTVKSSEKMIRIVDELTERGEVGVTELADATGFHKSTVYVHLQTMLENGLVVNTDGRYQLSLKFLSISEEIRTQRVVYRHGRGEIESLAKETGELTCLCVPEEGRTVIVHTARGEKASQTISDGTRIPMTDSPFGRVLLAFGADSVSDDEQEPAEVDLETIRENGYDVSTDQSVGGIPYIAEPEPDRPRSESHRTDVRNRAVAAPILRGEEPVGAVGVTGPSKRISGDYRDHVRQQVVQTAAMIEKKVAVGTD